jgi:protein-L-isoaspartate(D-aspartate) O-methyltransferase
VTNAPIIRAMERLAALALTALIAGCALEVREVRQGSAAANDPTRRARERMVDDQIAARGISDAAVLEAMRQVPRHRFLPPAQEANAYEDHPLPIGFDQTISQPYIVAYMTQALSLGPSDRVLEIGTGSGYQAAVLAEIVREVYTIEIVPELAAGATKILSELGYENVRVRHGDGYRGWPEAAPFDAIIVTAAPRAIPQPLIDQLALEGRMVVPVGDWYQELVIVTKTTDGIVEQKTIPVRFVPMTGEAERERPR